MQKWVVINKKADFKGIGKEFDIDQVTARIIRNRDLVEQEEIRKYLTGGLEDLYSPYLLKDVELLTDILQEKINSHKKIRIIGDYDIDGVMASYILKRALLRCGANVSVAIPERIKDGYGLNKNLILRAKEDGIDTIITCDNGIAAIEEVAYAKECSMTVLITDHHEIPPQGEENMADAIVNPHQTECNYPNKELCGAAVAWKVVCVLYEKMHIPSEESEEFLENVAFATVGDVMTLLGENRILVKEGLKRIRRTNNIGMKALIAQNGLTPEQIKAYHFGFVLGPCINASGRLDTAKRALTLLLEDEEEKATILANELVVLNQERKAITQQGVERAIQIYESNGYEQERVVVIYLPDMHESIAGIVAGRIREKYHKPTFILTKGEAGVKGSGRSTESYSMYEEMCKCSQLFTKFGGHPMAAGLSLPEEHVELFRKEINGICNLTTEDEMEKVKIDVPMPVDYVTCDLVREFSVLEPFGKDNERPLFADRNLRIVRIWIVGKQQNVLRLNLVSQAGNLVSVIYFGDIDSFEDTIIQKFGAEQLQKAFEGKENSILISMVYFPKLNYYHGEENLQLEMLYFS